MGDEGVNLERENESEVCSGRGGFVMDTPERKQISAPISKFEDSPVFNYLNNLSPIQAVKSVHITQSFNSLSFASLPSVFTSPHVSSIKESKFLRRHQLSDPSKPEFSSENGNKVCRNVEVRDIDPPQNFDPGSSAGEAFAEPPDESSVSIELSRIMSYEFVNSDYDPITHCGGESKCTPDLTGLSTALVPYVQSDSAKGSFGSEVNIGGMRQIDENKEASGCDWENLLSNTTDLLISDSSNDSRSLKDPSQKSLEPGTSFCSYLTDDLQNTGVVEAVGLSQLYETENTSSQHKDSGDLKELAEDQDILVSLSNCMAGDTSEKVDDELASNLHRGMRRRCLVFEVVGSCKKHLDDGSNCGPSMLAQSHDNIASSDKHLAPIKPGNDTPRCILPGIGLHLNAFAATSVDQKGVKHEALATGGKPISVSHSAALNSLNSEDITNNSLVVTASERDMLPAEGGDPIVEDAVQASGYMVNEAFKQSSPKKKRRRLENGGESEACKRCNCKKSKCLKLYCECFAAGVYCVEPCSCQECFNKPIHEDTVLATRKQIESRNPLAFAPKVIRSSGSMIEIGEESSKTPASARHKRGCNCKKSGCLKKYCECYQGGVGCSINCRCEGCKNAFGRKDGSTSTGTEVELEEEQVDKCERSVVDRSLPITTIQNDAEQSMTFALPATPSRFVRQSTQEPFSSKSNEPLPSSFLAIGSPSILSSSRRFGKVNQPQAEFVKHIQTAREDEMPKILHSNEDEMPKILHSNDSPISVVKLASPNSKRVSPPHCNTGSPPGQRSSRKLILQSIPSFPSLHP